MCPGDGPPGPRDGESRATASPTPAQQIDDTTATESDINRSGRQGVYDVLAGLRRRREHVVRSEGGDPEYPNDRQFHRPTVGLRAAGYREGFGRGGTDALRRVWPYIPIEHRGEVTRIAADYHGGEVVA
jgi:hypothetical protein